MCMGIRRGSRFETQDRQQSVEEAHGARQGVISIPFNHQRSLLFKLAVCVLYKTLLTKENQEAGVHYRGPSRCGIAANART